MFKKIALIGVMLLMCCFAVLACFMDDPWNFFGTTQQQMGGGEGDGAWHETIWYPPGLIEFPGNWNGEEVEANTAQSFPMTFITEFTGFADKSRVTRACLLYLNKQGKWIIISDIKNPSWKVDSNTGAGRSLFGKASIPSSYGYRPGEILVVRTYYKSATQQTFNLETELQGTVRYVNNLSNVVKIYVSGNTTPE